MKLTLTFSTMSSILLTRLTLQYALPTSPFWAPLFLSPHCTPHHIGPTPYPQSLPCAPALPRFRCPAHSPLSTSSPLPLRCVFLPEVRLSPLSLILSLSWAPLPHNAFNAPPSHRNPLPHFPGSPAPLCTAPSSAPFAFLATPPLLPVFLLLLSSAPRGPPPPAFSAAHVIALIIYCSLAPCLSPSNHSINVVCPPPYLDMIPHTPLLLSPPRFDSGFSILTRLLFQRFPPFTRPCAVFCFRTGFPSSVWHLRIPAPLPATRDPPFFLGAR